MTRGKEEDRSQKTPGGEEIPVPKRGDFIRDLEKAAEKLPEKKSGRGKKRKKEE